MNKKYEKYTLGKSCSAIYLVSLLNETTNKIDRNVLRYINDFKTIFFQLLKAHENKHIDEQVVFSFITAKRIQINVDKNNFLNKGYSPLVVNLCFNICITELKKFTRKQLYFKNIQKSAISRAKNFGNFKGNNLKNITIETYGKNADEELNTTVYFNQYGIPKIDFNYNNYTDIINDESIKQKSFKRLTRQGKSTEHFKDE